MAPPQLPPRAPRLPQCNDVIKTREHFSSSTAFTDGGFVGLDPTQVGRHRPGHDQGGDGSSRILLVINHDWHSELE
jgi:hypothetical protein